MPVEGTQKQLAVGFFSQEYNLWVRRRPLIGAVRTP